MATIKRAPKKAAARGADETVEGTFSRRTITIPPDMEAAIDSLVGRRKFSAFAQRAFTHELQRESIARWLDEREAARSGKPLSSDALQFAERTWRERK
jgi:Arc/MetJ-type ribon-helix-helix transcriptional regulator